MLYTRRADILLHMRRPLAAVRDCSQALVLNPNYARAFRTRGLARRHLQDWEHAHLDLSQAQAIDYDEGLEPVHRFVQDKWAQLYAMRHAYELQMEARADALATEKTRREIAELERIQKEACQECAEEQAAEEEGMAAKVAASQAGTLSAMLDNPKLRAAAREIDSQPQSFFDYRSDPEIGPILTCLWDFQNKRGRLSGA